MHGKSRYREPRPGDMAMIRRGRYGTNNPDDAPVSALILSYASSNVYEPSSCEVYCNGEIFWIETKYITLHPRD